MGNSVNLSKLTISILNDELAVSDHQPEPMLDNEPLEFPFYLTKPISDDIVLYESDQKLAQHSGMLPLLYKCTLFGLSNIVFENMGARLHEKIWRQIEPGQNVKVQIGDQVKIGNLICKLKYLVNSRQSMDSRISNGDSSMQSRRSKQNYLQSERASRCRVCFDSNESESNPLINLCKCGGSVRYTHYRCLKNWIRNKVKTTEQPNCTIYEFSALSCELCQKQLPTHFYRQDRIYSLIEQENMSPPYAILQTKMDTPSVRNQKIEIYRVKLNEGLKVNAGRSADSDIPLKYPTVSRSHFLLFYTQKELYIKDLKSKYGTFLFSRNAQFSFNLDNGLTLMVKKSKIMIRKEKESFLSLGCCKGLETAQVKIMDDSDDKFTVETSWDLLDFLQ